MDYSTPPDHVVFINTVAKHYDILKRKYRAFCRLNGYNWDEDIFSDTILKCYNAIEKKGKLNDTTDQGVQDYLFISYKLNLKREAQYARNQKRDRNVDNDSIGTMYERWYNDNHNDERAKLLSDLFTDFSTLYIMHTVESNFPSDDFQLFKQKMLCGYTYKQVQDKNPGQRRIRQRIVAIREWLRSNVKKETVKTAFQIMYSEII